MIDRISVEPIHGMPTGTKTPCPACGNNYCLADYVEVVDHMMDKKYSFAILTCGCGLIRNRGELSHQLPMHIYMRVFFN